MWLIRRWKYFQQDGLSLKLVWAVYGVKIAAGIFYGYFTLHFYGKIDSFSHFYASNILYGVLTEFGDVWSFLKLTLGPRGGDIPEPLQKYMTHIEGYWYSVNNYNMLRYNALLRLVSFGYYNVHVVWHTFFVLIGNIALYRFFYAYFPERSTVLKLAVFWVPSVIFWTSGLHKDGLMFSLIGLFLWRFKCLLDRPLSLKNIVIFIPVVFLLFLIRNYILLLMLPGLAALIISMKWQRYIGPVFVAIHIICWVCLFNVHLVIPRIDLMDKLQNRQKEFKELQGQTNMHLSELGDSGWTVLKNLPEAFAHTFLRPHFWECHNTRMYLLALENYVIFILMVWCFFQRPGHKPTARAVLWLCFFFSLTLFLFIGIMVPNMGAIARYKSVALTLLVVFILLRFRDNWIPGRLTRWLG